MNQPHCRFFGSLRFSPLLMERKCNPPTGVRINYELKYGKGGKIHSAAQAQQSCGQAVELQLVGQCQPSSAKVCYELFDRVRPLE